MLGGVSQRALGGLRRKGREEFRSGHGVERGFRRCAAASRPQCPLACCRPAAARRGKRVVGGRVANDGGCGRGPIWSGRLGLVGSGWVCQGLVGGVRSGALVDGESLGAAAAGLEERRGSSYLCSSCGVRVSRLTAGRGVFGVAGRPTPPPRGAAAPLRRGAVSNRTGRPLAWERGSERADGSAGGDDGPLSVSPQDGGRGRKGRGSGAGLGGRAGAPPPRGAAAPLRRGAFRRGRTGLLRRGRLRKGVAVAEEEGSCGGLVGGVG